MKRLSLVIAALVLTLAACAPAAGNSPLPVDTPTDGPVLEATPTAAGPASTTSPAEQAAIASLAGALGMQTNQISLVSAESVTWPNGCMGVQRIGVLCTNKQIPGYKIVLQANGQQYEFHTNGDGSVIVPAQGMQAAGPAEDAVRKQLASNLGVDVSQISVVSNADVEWPDSCLGVQQEGLMCAQIVTPGHLIVLAANGLQFEYHTNGDGSSIQPATLFITWKQDGGLAGFCNSLTIYLSGEVHASSCSDVKDARLKDLLTSADQTQLKDWQSRFGHVSIDLSDPKNAADAMTRTMSFNGSGSGQPSTDEQHTLYNWAQTLFQRIKIGS